jgi:hypothetical protein
VIAYRCGDPHALARAVDAATHSDLVPTSRAQDRHRYRHPALSYATVAVYAERFDDAERCSPRSSIPPSADASRSH